MKLIIFNKDAEYEKVSSEILFEQLKNIKGAIIRDNEITLPTDEGFFKLILSTENVIDEENPQTDQYGTQRYYNSDNQLHRNNNQPAVIYANGSKYWCKNGQYHRDNDLPAAIHADGSQHWYKNGQRYTPVEVTNKNPEKDFNKIKELLTESN